MHDRHLHAVLQQTVGRLQAEQAAADHHGFPVAARRSQHGLDIGDVAKTDNARLVRPWHGNDEGIGAGCEQQAIVWPSDTCRGPDLVPYPVDRDDGVSRHQIDPVSGIPLARVEHDVVDGLLAGQHR